ncbi:MAG: GNAT family N-acetyltransferase [Anaerolineales bacterium]|nr:GNAT family N-acetyltransferase [Anaerolineales bacterium]
MAYHFAPMNTKYAQTVAGWHYDGVYAFYDFAQGPEDLAELLDPCNWENRYFAVLNGNGQLTGFFCFDVRGGAVELGLGMRPEDTGQRLGRAFVQAGLEFARRRFHPKRFHLEVAAFNQRAIRLYEKLGFLKEKTHLQRTNGGEFEFVQMIRNDTTPEIRDGNSHRASAPTRPRAKN